MTVRITGTSGYQIGYHTKMATRVSGSQSCLSSFFAWCPERDLNSHPLVEVRILSPLRLPISPSGQDGWDISNVN